MYYLHRAVGLGGIKKFDWLVLYIYTCPFQNFHHSDVLDSTNISQQTGQCFQLQKLSEDCLHQCNPHWVPPLCTSLHPGHLFRTSGTDTGPRLGNSNDIGLVSYITMPIIKIFSLLLCCYYFWSLDMSAVKSLTKIAPFVECLACRSGRTDSLWAWVGRRFKNFRP